MPHLRERLVEFCAHLIHGNLQSHSTTSASYVPLPLHDDERTEEFNRVPVASRRFAAATGGDDIAAEYSGNGNGIGTGSPSLAVQEKPRRKWFSYMRTKDFWAVMVLGYVIVPVLGPLRLPVGANGIYPSALEGIALLYGPASKADWDAIHTGRSSPSVLPARTRFPGCWPTRAPACPPCKPSSTTYCSISCTRASPYTATGSGNGESCC